MCSVRADEVVADREEGGGGAVVDGDLRVDVLDVVVDGADGDGERCGDLLVAQAAGEEDEDLDLAGGEAGGGGDAGGGVAGGGEDAIDGAAAQAAGAGLVAE